MAVVPVRDDAIKVGSLFFVILVNYVTIGCVLGSCPLPKFVLL